MTNTAITREVAETYFDAWRAKDWERLRGTLADDVEFLGVMGTASGIDECIAGLTGMAEHVMNDLELKVRVADGDDVITWFDLVAQNGVIIPTANWSHVRDDKIDRIRVTFDPRPLG